MQVTSRFTPNPQALLYFFCISLTLALVLQYPEGYLEAVAAKEKEKENKNEEDVEETPTKGKRKRKSQTGRCKNVLVWHWPYLKIFVCIPNILIFPIVVDEKSSPAKGTPKKMKVEAYKLSKEQKNLIKDDELNKKLWDEAMESLSLGPVRTGQRLRYLFGDV